MVDKSLLQTPFSVTAYVKASSQEVPQTDKDFAALDDAKALFHELKKDPALFVYLTEIGAFADNNGTLKIDHMIFNTNDYDWWRS